MICIFRGHAKAILILLLALILLPATASAVPDNINLIINKSKVIHNAVPDGIRPTTFKYNITNAAGTNNDSYIYGNGNFNANFTDVLVTINNATVVPWTVNIANGSIIINATINGTLNLYYGDIASNMCFSCNNSNATYQAWDNFTQYGTTLKSNWSVTGTGSATIVSSALSIIADTKADYGAWPQTGNVIHASFTPATGGAGTTESGILTRGGALGNGLGWIHVQNTNTLNIFDNGASVASVGLVLTAGVWYESEMIIWPDNKTEVRIWQQGSTKPSTATLTKTAFTSASTGSALQAFTAGNVGVTTSKFGNISMRLFSSQPFTNWTAEVTNNIQGVLQLSPTNGSTITAVYPPLATTVNFTWYDVAYPSDELQVAQDLNFNLIVHDGFHTTDYANVQLEAGKTYYWRVKQYNSTTATFGATSNVWSVTLTSPSTSSATSAVQGIVYEVINGVQTPISGSIVYLYNTTTSFQFTTGSNGYFLFQNLANVSTYNIYATNAPIYNPTSVFPVTTENGTIVTNNLLMTRFFSPFVPNYVYEKFTVRNTFGQYFVGSTINVYEGSAVVPLFTKLTDTMGQATFQLIKDTYYRVEISGGGISGMQTIYVYGKEEEYLILINSFPQRPDLYSVIHWNITSTKINSTHTNLSLIYNDSVNSTSILNFYAINITDLNNRVTICSQSFIYNISIAANCTVPSNKTFAYLWGFNATSDVFGFIDPNLVITFGGHGNQTEPLIDTGAPPGVMNWLSIILIVIVGAMFKSSNIKLGFITVPILALFLWWAGWFTQSILVVGVAVVIGFIMYFRASEVKTQY